MKRKGFIVMKHDHLIRVVSHDGLLRGAAAVTTQLVTDICARQQTDFTATVALGRLLTGGALLGCLLKGQQRLALMIEGNGPIERMSVEADADGRIRGTIRNPVTGLPPKDERFDVAGAVGLAGFLHVQKDLGLKNPYHSMVQLQTSEIGDDLAWYLTNSEQVPSSIGLGVELASDGSIAAAGGFLVQALPPGDEDLVAQLVDRIGNLPPMTSQLRQGLEPIDILKGIFGEVDFSVQHETSLSFHCPCSRDYISKVLMGLGTTELKSLLEEQGQAEVTCEYCHQVYAYDAAALQKLIDSIG
jgi:molecular chaperone Hsp33